MLGDLAEADLAGANLRQSDFLESRLAGANLSKADLRGANLQWAILSDAYPWWRQPGRRVVHLEGARYDRFTRWPRGFNPRAAGARLDE